MKDLQANLARKYKNEGSKIEKRWSSFDEKQRAKLIEKCVGRGQMGARMIIFLSPEWNLRDLAHSGPKKLIEMLNYRPTNTIFEQYRSGINGTQDDAAYNIDLNTRNRLQDPRPQLIVEDNLLLSMNEEKYGVEIHLSRLSGNPLATIQQARRDNLCVQERLGITIMERQFATYQILNTIVGLRLQSTPQPTVAKERAEKTADVSSEALSKLSLHENTPNSP